MYFLWAEIEDINLDKLLIDNFVISLFGASEMRFDIVSGALKDKWYANNLETISTSKIRLTVPYKIQIFSNKTKKYLYLDYALFFRIVAL